MRRASRTASHVPARWPLRHRPAARRRIAEGGRSSPRVTVHSQRVGQRCRGARFTSHLRYRSHRKNPLGGVPSSPDRGETSNFLVPSRREEEPYSCYVDDEQRRRREKGGVFADAEPRLGTPPSTTSPDSCSYPSDARSFSANSNSSCSKDGKSFCARQIQIRSRNPVASNDHSLRIWRSSASRGSRRERPGRSCPCSC